MKKPTAKQKAEQLRLLAIAFYENMNVTHDECEPLGLPGKRPFGFSSYGACVCQIIGMAPEDSENGSAVWSDDQNDYGVDLLDNHLGPYLVKHGIEYFKNLPHAQTPAG